jgi:hypothetical protein
MEKRALEKPALEKPASIEELNPRRRTNDGLPRRMGRSSEISFFGAGSMEFYLDLFRHSVDSHKHSIERAFGWGNTG